MSRAFADPPEEQPLKRPQWMALLARAPIDLLESALDAHAGNTPQWLRKPETGLMMVQGRAGGTGERFNLGEVTVTRCVLRLRGPNRCCCWTSPLPRSTPPTPGP